MFIYCRPVSTARAQLMAGLDIRVCFRVAQSPETQRQLRGDSFPVLTRKTETISVVMLLLCGKAVAIAKLGDHRSVSSSGRALYHLPSPNDFNCTFRLPYTLWCRP